MANNNLFSAVIKGVTAGVGALVLSCICAALLISFTPDPLSLTAAAAYGCCLICGTFASVFAGKSKKEKPLWASLLAGLTLCTVLMIASLVTGDVTGGLIRAGSLMAGVMTGLLAVPSVSRGKSKYRKLVKTS